VKKPEAFKNFKVGPVKDYPCGAKSRKENAGTDAENIQISEDGCRRRV
jgi:hypothetical protein